MGIFDFFKQKKKRENVNTTTTLIKSESKISTIPTTSVKDNFKSNSNLVSYEAFYLSVHPDLKDLLWFGSGKYKNYVCIPKTETYKFNGMTCTIIEKNEEPSLIYTNQTIQVSDDIFSVERPDYFPTYTSLNSRQKYVYWKFLSNPYDERFNVGYAFLLFYGLERMMLSNEKFEKAFEVVLKLRDVFNNKSFQSYTANTLILMCLKNQRVDLIALFANSLDKEFELNFNANLLLLYKYGLMLPLEALDVVRIAKDIEFTNINYIKKYPDIFVSILDKKIHDKYKNGLILNDIISESNFIKIPKCEGYIFSNTSLQNKILIPNIINDFKLKRILFNLLEDTHEEVKSYLAEMRKNGEHVQEIKKEIKEIKIASFDTKAEEELLQQLKQSKDIFSIHFTLMALITFYYKYRDLGENYVDECLKYCEEDIKLCPMLKKEWKNDVGGRIGRIPTFERICSIYEKRKMYASSLEVCDIALNYYEGSFEHEEIISKFKRKKESLSKKVNG